MARVLFSRPQHDITLSYLYYASKDLVNLSEKLGHKTLNKEREEANEENIRKIIEKLKPNLIMFNGHGSPEIICGHKDKVLISLKNADLLKDTITYSFSCSSALVSGEKAVNIGAISFIGYDFDFVLGKNPDSEASPRRDKIAELFLNPSNILFSHLLKGATAKYAVQKAKDKMKENIWYLRTTDDFPEAADYAPFLFSNYLSLNIKGDEESRI